jgi:hypothetical protein
MKKGAEQIAAQGIRGFVAMNLDAYLDSLTLDELPDAVGQSFNDRVSEAHDAFMRLADRPAAIGALLFGTRVDWVFGGEKPTIRWVNPLQWIGFSELEPAERFREFFDTNIKPRLEAGLGRIGALSS